MKENLYPNLSAPRYVKGTQPKLAGVPAVKMAAVKMAKPKLQPTGNAKALAALVSRYR